jgi:hypothetical protein
MRSIFAATALCVYGAGLSAAPIGVSGGGSASCDITSSLGEFSIGLGAPTVSISFESGSFYGGCGIVAGIKDVFGSTVRGPISGWGTASIDGLASRYFEFSIIPDYGYLRLLDESMGEIGFVEILGHMSIQTNGGPRGGTATFVVTTPEPGTYIAGLAIIGMLLHRLPRARRSRNRSIP